MEQESDLEDCHHPEAPTELHIKKDTTKDLLTIFWDIVTVQFKKNDIVEVMRGQWCLQCKLVSSEFLTWCKGLLDYGGDEKTIRVKGLRTTFFMGSNSSCCQHICQHYNFYKQKCSEENILMNHRAIPPSTLKEMQESTRLKNKQSTLKGVIVTGPHPTMFTWDGLLDAVAKFMARDDQSLAVTNKAAFRNSLIMMIPKTVTANLPTMHTVSDYIHNQFVAQLMKLNTEIKVSNKPNILAMIKTVTHLNYRLLQERLQQQVMDGLLTIQRECFLEWQLTGSKSRMANGNYEQR